MRLQERWPMPELVCPACHGCAEVHVQAYDLALRRRGRPGLLREGEAA
jgi:hypothetical protein